MGTITGMVEPHKMTFSVYMTVISVIFRSARNGPDAHDVSEGEKAIRWR